MNNSIVYQDRIQCPGPDEVAAVVRESGELKEAVCRCRADSTSTTVWLNTVGTFGIASAPYWWSRLFSLVGRFVGYVFHDNQSFFHQVYVDDLHGSF